MSVPHSDMSHSSLSAFYLESLSVPSKLCARIVIKPIDDQEKPIDGGITAGSIHSVEKS